MNSKIEKAQVRLHEAKLERERKKVRYDAHVIIIEGHRRTLHELENMNQQLMREFMDADKAIGEFNSQLQQLITEEHESN